ncbi:CapA family protein, partial [Candidatus Parcubacteria bacterium]|nr:CapA family protein [Candidatus Parcubacteria bacterium]
EGDFTFPFQKIKASFAGADLIFGNLESVISDKGYQVGSIYSFRAEPEAIEGLKFAGFSVVNLAQNHALDYTTAALEDTMIRLKANGIEYIGAGLDAQEAFGLKVKEIKGTFIGFLGYTNLGPNSWRAGLENKTGIAWIDKESFPSLRENIQTAKQQVDILIVSLHAGEEYQVEPTLFQKDFANLVISEGADLVLMHHSHIIQPLEKIGGKFVAYGLGNFIFDQAFSKETMEGGFLEITLQNKAISEVVLKKVQLNEFYQPELPDF